VIVQTVSFHTLSACKTVTLPKVLFVDDDPAQRYLIKRHLTAGQYDVITAASVSEALELLQDFEPDLVITDIVMPKASGFDLVASIQSSGKSGKFPIIFLSAENNLQNRVHSYHSGGEYFLAKPWSPEELLAVIASSLRRSRWQQEQRSTNPNPGNI
jgi:DNA-binding response OmpR family regulator